METRTASTRTLLALTGGLILALLSGMAMADVNARLDRYRVYEGDPVTLVIESAGQKGAEPDLSPLSRDFRISGTGTSTQVNIINGRRSDKTTWTIQLEPNRRGTLRVPPISVGNEQTAALEVEVTEIPEQSAEDRSGPAFLEAEVDTGTQAVYVQQQIPYTLRLYYDDSVTKGDIQTPQPENGVVEQLGEDKRYTVTRNARHYNVLERHFAISPEKSGPFRIPPAAFQGTVATKQRSRALSSMNDPFQRLFRNSPFAASGKPLRLHSKPITIDVKPRPDTTGSHWLPAEQITLQDSWVENPPGFRSGEPVSRTITLQARGLTGPQIPDLPLAQPRGMRLYPEPPSHESRTDGEKVYGIHEQTFTYIPETTGNITIPAVEVQWWNTLSDAADTTRLPEWQITVLPGSADTQPQTAAPAEAETTGTGNTSEGDEAVAVSENNAGRSEWLHKALVAGGVLLLLAVLLFIFKKLRRKTPGDAPESPPQKPATNRPGLKALMQQLETATSAGDARTAATALLELGSLQWPADPPRSLGTLAARLDRGNGEILALDRTLYSANAAHWNGAPLWQAVKDGLQTRDTHTGRTDDGIEPLYPQRALKRT